MALAAPFPSVRTTPVRRRAIDVPTKAALHLTARGRIALFWVSLLAIVGGALMFSQVADASASASGIASTSIVVVQAGDSLWSIAQQVSVGTDPRAMVARIRELNGLNQAVVFAGQSLVIPVA